MPSRFSVRSAGPAILVLALAAAAVVVVHHQTLGFGFDYDDYHFVRPYPLEEVAAAFHGPWDPTGIEVPFYRPLTVAFFALRFELLNLNATAYHGLSLALFALAAAMAGWFATALSGRAVGGCIAALLFACHPAMPYSLVAWVTNQMHLLQALVVLGALLWWYAVRTRTLVWWLPLLGFAAAAFLVKEDGLMLLPAILTTHVLAKLVLDRQLQLPWRFALLAAAAMAILLFVRTQALGGLGGYGRPTTDVALLNLSKGLNGVFRLIPADRPWQPAASWFATLVPVAALLTWPWISRGARMCLIAGAAIAFLFNLPFMFVSKAEQAYLLGFGATLTLTGGSLALIDLCRERLPLKALAAAAIAGGIITCGLVSRDIDRDFDPFGPYVLSHDDIVQTWWPVAPELKDYLRQKREQPGVSANPVDALTRVSFGVMGPETNPHGEPYFWMAGRATDILIARHVRSITIPVRHEMGAFREPARARIVVDGRPADELRLDDGRWQAVRLTLRPEAAPRIGRMHRIRISIDHAWRPSEIIPGSTDHRVLGLQIGEIRTN